MICFAETPFESKYYRSNDNTVDFPQRRMPVIILINGWSLKLSILSKYWSRAIIFIVYGYNHKDSAFILTFYDYNPILYSSANCSSLESFAELTSS